MGSYLPFMNYPHLFCWERKCLNLLCLNMVWKCERVWCVWGLCWYLDHGNLFSVYNHHFFNVDESKNKSSKKIFFLYVNGCELYIYTLKECSVWKYKKKNTRHLTKWQSAVNTMKEKRRSYTYHISHSKHIIFFFHVI